MERKWKPMPFIITGLQRSSRTYLEMEGIRRWEGNLGFHFELSSFLSFTNLSPVTFNCSGDSRMGTSSVVSQSWLTSFYVNKPRCPHYLYLDSLIGIHLLVFILKTSKPVSTDGLCLSEFSLNKLFSFILPSLGISYKQKCLYICLTWRNLIIFSRVAGQWQPLYSSVKRFWWGFLFLGDFTILR